MNGKKFTLAASLTAAIVFGGVLQSVDASASTSNADQSQKTVQYHKIYSGKFNFCKYYANQQTQQKPSDHQQPGTNQGSNSNLENNGQQDKQSGSKQTEQTKPNTGKEDQTASNSSALSAYEQQVVDLTNKERTSRGLKALKVDTELSKVARMKSQDMANKNYFSHTSPTYGSPFDMMKQFGITYKSAGENIAKGQRTPQEVVNAWMNSEGHRANILNSSFTHIGVGYVSNGNIWTQQFIGK